MKKLYDYIDGKYDSSYTQKLYGPKLSDFLNCEMDAYYINDIHILKMFHDIYLDVKDKYDKYDLKYIKSLSDKYLFLIGRIKEYEELGNYNKCDYDIDHRPFIDTECINYVRQNSSLFSLSELFEKKHLEDRFFGGVCVISKIQTVCMYNDDSLGYMGSGYHNDSFHKIIKAIYNERFVDGAGLKFNKTGQDIKVGFSNNASGIIRIIVDVPVPINSSQFESLKILNDEIKKYMEYNDREIRISASIENYYDEDFCLEFDMCDNLDEALKWVIISDSYKPIFEDKNMVGFVNGENHFDDVNIKYGKQK